MNMRTYRWIASVATAVSFVGTASAADYATIVLETTVNRPINEVWAKVGEFCAIKDWMKISCEYSAGSGGLGTIRRVAGRINEVMVAKTEHSYTYTVPTATDLYHGTLEAVAEGEASTKLLYTIIYDQEPLGTAKAKTADREKRAKTFTGALANMKTQSEGQ